MKKSDLRDTIANRNPLAQRQAIQPMDLYTTPEESNPDTPKSGNPEILKAGMTEIRESRLPESPGSGRHVVKYSTQLTPAMIKAIKREAFERECDAYEVVLEALEAYFKR